MPRQAAEEGRYGDNEWSQEGAVFMVKSAAAPEFLHLWPVAGQWVTESTNKHLPSMSWKVADN